MCRHCETETLVQILQQTVRDNDPEGLDLITLVAFEHFAGECQTPAIIEMREEAMDLARTRLANGEASTRHPDISIPIFRHYSPALSP
jgi:hypothetical protein